MVSLVCFLFMTSRRDTSTTAARQEYGFTATIVGIAPKLHVDVHIKWRDSAALYLSISYIKIRDESGIISTAIAMAQRSVA